jgi:FkbM family methyltransferase
VTNAIVRRMRLIVPFLKGYDFSDPRANGEYRFLHGRLAPGMTVFDVGANVGEFALEAFHREPHLQVHCFEPVAETYRTLESNLRNVPAGGGITLNNFGLSDRDDVRDMVVYGANAGSNSLYMNPYHAERSAHIEHESVSLRTLDGYMAEKGVDRVDLLKIDVEGHEQWVLEGARSALSQGRIRTIMFEYNDYWRQSGGRLASVVGLLQRSNFRLWRLSRLMNIPVRSDGRDLENFRHSNYVAILDGAPR